MYLAIFHEKSSWVILYFPEILCWNPMFLFECYAVTMLENIFLHPLLLLCPNIGSSIGHLVLILFNKMGLLNVKIDILLRQLVSSFSIVMFLFVFGGMLFLQLVAWLIVCPHLYYMTKSLIPSFFLPNLFISFLLVSLAVLVLFILSHLDRTSSPLRLRNASSWDALDFRRAIVVIPRIFIVIFSPLMSPSLRILHSSHPRISSHFWSIATSLYLPPFRCALSSSSGLSSSTSCCCSSSLFSWGTWWLTSCPDPVIYWPFAYCSLKR